MQSQYSGNSFSLPVMTLTDANGDDPSQVANAYQMLGEESESDDLIGVTGSAANGYRLAYYPSMFGPGMYDMPIHLTALTPTGGTDWNNWRIATTRLTAGVVMYLWNSSTGALHLWTDLAMTDHGDMTGTLAHTQYEISSSWNPGIPLSTLQITDVNRDGVPDLWTVDTNGVLTTHLVSGLSAHSPATIRTQRPQQLR